MIENEITDQYCDEYGFSVSQREVYRILYENDEVILYIWGVTGIDVPMYNE